MCFHPFFPASRNVEKIFVFRYIFKNMYKPYKEPVMTAFPDIKVPEPRISKFVLFLIKLLGRAYLFLFYGIARIVLKEEMYLVEPFKRALAGENRCILAFRHPNGGEPQVITWFTLFKLWWYAKKNKVKFARMPHTVMVYGYEVVRWGGWPARYVMPNVGAMPVHHSKMDREGMARIYKAITEGPYPVALAPEGQVSYTTDIIPRLESGIVRIGFHAAQVLADKNIAAPVEILPFSIHFRYGSWGKIFKEINLRKIEKLCGFVRKVEKKFSFEERLNRCRFYILEINEERYNIKGDASLPFEDRLEKVIYAALETAERLLDVKKEGDFFARLYKIRQLCWDRIFLPDLENLKSIPLLKRRIRDLGAGEAWYILRHQELADFGWYFRLPLPTEKTEFHNKVEYVQNLWDFASRTMGGALSDRKLIFPRKVTILAGDVINLSKRLPQYKTDKKGTIAASLADLEKEFLNCIERMKKLEG